MIVTIGSLVFSKKHVTFSPSLSTIDAVLVAKLVVVLAPPVQCMAVSTQPLAAPSVTVYDPGKMLKYVWVFGSVGSASSSKLNADGLSPPVVVNAKSCATFGIASLMIVTVALPLTTSGVLAGLVP